jgi:hypothetical protein
LPHRIAGHNAGHLDLEALNPPSVGQTCRQTGKAGRALHESGTFVRFTRAGADYIVTMPKPAFAPYISAEWYGVAWAEGPRAREDGV